MEFPQDASFEGASVSSVDVADVCVVEILTCSLDSFTLPARSVHVDTVPSFPRVGCLGRPEWGLPVFRKGPVVPVELPGAYQLTREKVSYEWNLGVYPSGLSSGCCP